MIHKMMNKYCGYLYEIIIPTSTGEKHYYGKKECDKRSTGYTICLDYWGSGIIIKDWFLKHTNNLYTSRHCPEKIAITLGVKRIIHGFYKTRKELCVEEKKLIKKHLGKEYCINLADGGTGGNTGHYVCTEKTREKKRNIHLGTKFWTNGIINKKSKKCPGSDWKLGMTISKKEKLARSKKMQKQMKNIIFSINHRNKLSLVHNKPVMCIELNKAFSSIKEACLSMNFSLGSSVNITRACRDQTKTYKHYHWKYI